eukprot:SAG11_NODE_116_length_16002_cov_19.164560_1_plen_112_part_00
MSKYTRKKIISSSRQNEAALSLLSTRFTSWSRASILAHTVLPHHCARAARRVSVGMAVSRSQSGFDSSCSVPPPRRITRAIFAAEAELVDVVQPLAAGLQNVPVFADLLPC